jgi:hypothetical protein
MDAAELERIRVLIRARRYLMTSHAEEEMDADALTAFDLESVIVTGRFTERQRDRQSDEWKYLVRGQALEGAIVTLVSKFGATGILVLIAVFIEQQVSVWNVRSAARVLHTFGKSRAVMGVKRICLSSRTALSSGAPTAAKAA